MARRIRRHKGEITPKSRKEEKGREAISQRKKRALFKIVGSPGKIPSGRKAGNLKTKMNEYTQGMKGGNIIFFKNPVISKKSSRGAAKDELKGLDKRIAFQATTATNTKPGSELGKGDSRGQKRKEYTGWGWGGGGGGVDFRNRGYVRLKKSGGP